jgi:two-component system, cell cycle sensor histidine kinase and response regulator CckA
MANQITILDENILLPEPKQTTIREILKDPPLFRLVEIPGVIRSSSLRQNRQELVLRDRNDVLPVHIFRRPPTDPPARLPDTKIRFTGVIVSGGSTTVGAGEPPLLIVRNWNDSKVIKLAPKYPFRRTLRPIQDVLKVNPKRVLESCVRVRGKVVRVRDSGNFDLRDDTGEINVQVTGSDDVTPGDVMDVIGFTKPDEVGTGISLRHGRAQRLGLPRSKLNAAGEPNTAPALADYVPMLLQISDIRRLKNADLAARPPVNVQANLVYRDDEAGRLFVQDESGGIAITTLVTPLTNRLGDLLHVTGHAAASDTAPVIAAARITGLGTNRIAKPMPGTSGELALGRLDSQWIRLEGVGRTVERVADGTRLTLARNHRKYQVRINGAAPESLEPMIDARLTVTGVARTVLDDSGQNIGTEVLVAEAGDIHVDEVAPTNAFTIPPDSIDTLKRFRLNGSYTKRNRTTGTVTLAWPNLVFIDDGTNTLKARVARPTGLVPSHRAEVVGFPYLGPRGLEFEDAIVRDLGLAEAVEPQEMPAQDARTEGRDGQLITITGTLLKQVAAVPEHLLILQSGTETFPVVLPAMFVTPSLEEVREGSRIAATGILDLPAGGSLSAHSFRLLLPDADAIKMLAAPPWWTASRLTAAVGGMGALIALVLFWVNHLRQMTLRSKNRFTRAMNASPVAVTILSADTGHILEVNDRFLDLLGFEQRDVVDETLGAVKIWPDAPPTSQLWENAAAGAGSFEASWRTADGDTRNVLVSTETIELDGEDCLLMSAVDLTEKFQLLEQLRDSQKMEAVGKLAAGVAHDFNNLLTVIRGNTEILQEEIEPGSSMAELNDEVDTAAKRAADLTRQLLAFSRRQILKMGPVDLGKLVTESLRMLRRLLEENIRIETRLPASSPSVHADPGTLEQVLINMAVNARDAMPEGGTLTLTVDMAEVSPDEAARHPDTIAGTYLRLIISDTGCGMDAATRNQIFEPFYTTKAVGKGTGLGLATAYGIVRQHHGWIDVKSRPGAGTSFIIHLPTEAEAPESPTPDADNPTALPRGRESVLVVEDEAAIRRITTSVLTRAGYHVVPATDAAEALRAWDQAPDGFDLLLTDVLMPGPLTGLDLARKLLGQCPGLKVILMSGYSGASVRVEEIDEVGGVLISKPFARRTLTTKVREVLDEPVAV